MSCGSTWRTGREGRRRPSTPPSQSIARMPGISFTWAASPAEQQVSGPSLSGPYSGQI